MGAIEPWHLILLLAVVLLVVGPGKLPQVGRGVGEAIREFRQATSNAQVPPGEQQTGQPQTVPPSNATSTQPVPGALGAPGQGPVPGALPGGAQASTLAAPGGDVTPHA